MEYKLTDNLIEGYKNHLILEERSEGTVQKYLRDLRFFCGFLSVGIIISKEIVIKYKEYLKENYAVSTANSMLAAVNGLMSFAGWYECRVKPFKQQRRIFRDKERELSKEEYIRLLNAAKGNKNDRLFFIMETLCSTGIRISELRFITVEALKEGKAVVDCKGKIRTVFFAKKLKEKLLKYCGKKSIRSGPVFVTKSGKPMNRSNIWTQMKKLCQAAAVESRKVFPHNFRHLFAVTFYKLEKDIAKLADVLGHTSIETTRIYIMESGDEHIKQIERLGLVV